MLKDQMKDNDVYNFEMHQKIDGLIDGEANK